VCGTRVGDTGSLDESHHTAGGVAGPAYGLRLDRTKVR